MPLKQRLNDLRQRMRDIGIDVAVLSHPRDVLYYAGTARPATLVVGMDDAVVLVRRGVEQARREVTVELRPGGGFRRVAEVVTGQPRTHGTVGVAMDVLPANLYLRLREVLPGWEVRDLSDLVLTQRMVKDADEVAATEQAAAVADLGHAAFAQMLQSGVTELELAAKVEAAIRRAGHEAYQPLRHPGARGGGVLLASGEHLTVRGGHGLVVTGAGLSAASPYGASHRQVHAGDLLVLDIGSIVGGYTADESRTYVVGGPTAQQQALFEVTMAAEAAVFATLRPGTPIPQVYAAAKQVVSRGAAPHFGRDELVLPGFVGHGIGLELDEPPVLWEREERPVEEGMVLAVEVEVSAPDLGLMTKLEDTVVVEADGPRVLTAAPRSLTPQDG
jgi:Xaa-Pro aminopeptidase